MYSILNTYIIFKTSCTIMKSVNCQRKFQFFWLFYIHIRNTTKYTTENRSISLGPNKINQQSKRLT